MKKDLLIKLIKFFKKQQKAGYVIIEEIVSITETKRFTDNVKRGIILSLLESHGFNEGDFPELNAEPIPMKGSAKKDDVIQCILENCFKVEFWEFEMLNGRIMAEIPLN